MLSELTRRKRLRLWLSGRGDRIGCWLYLRGHARSAIGMWRACGLW